MIGREIGGYRIVEQVGMGGMAVVYKAFDPRTERYVALKVLPQQYSKDPTFLTRFENEARAISKLEHLHILPVFAYGEQDGTSYMAMRYMDSGTLSDRIRKSPLSFSEISKILRQLGEALDYAHSNGILHRDIKPSNALLDQSGNAYLTDFGIAKMVGDSSGLDLTGSGLIGTPFYMSPEQCRGERNLTPSSDLYALGVVLYEMATGHTPYRAETPLAVLQMHLMQPMPSARGVRPDLSESAHQVIKKSLEKEPADRYPSGRALADAFDRALASGETAPDLHLEQNTMVGDQPTSTVRPPTRTLPSATQQAVGSSTGTQPPTTGTVTVIKETRSPVPYIAAAIVAVIAILALVFAVLPADTRNSILTNVGVLQATATASPTITPSPTITASPTLTPTATATPLVADPFAAGTVGVVIASAGQNDTLNRLVRDLTGGGANVVQIDFTPNTPESQNDMLQTYNSSLLLWTEAGASEGELILNFVVRKNADNAIVYREAFYLGLERFQTTVTAETDARFARNIIDGLFAYLEDRPDDSLAALMRAESFAPAETDLSGVQFYQALATNDALTAIDLYTKVIETSPQLTEAYNNRGVNYLVADNTEAALTDLNQALTLNSDNPYIYNNRGILYAYISRNEDALDDLITAIGIKRDSDVIYANRGNVYWSLSQYDRAIEDFTRAIEINPNVPDYYVARATVQSYSGDTQTVIADLNTAIEQDPLNTQALLTRGTIKAQSSDSVGAQTDFEAILAFDPINFSANLELAKLNFNAYGDTEKALEYISTGLRDYDGDAEGWFLRGQIYNSLGQWQNAVSDLQRAVDLSPDYAAAVTELAYAQYRLDYDSAKAITALTQAIELDNNNAIAFNYLGLVYSESANTDNAIANFESAINANSGYKQAYLNMGVLYRNLNDDLKAIDYLTGALDIDADYVIALGERGYTYTEMGLYDEAATDLAKCRDLNPNYTLCAYYFGYLKYLQEDYFAAIQDLTQGLNLAPDAGAYNWRAQAYFRTNNLTAAINDMSSAIELVPTSADYYARRGLYYVNASNYTDGQTDINKALEIDSQNEFAYYALGTLSNDTGEYAAAVEAFTSAINLSPVSDNYLARATAYRYSDNLDAAEADLEAALGLDPSNSEAIFEQGMIAYERDELAVAIDKFSIYLQVNPDQGFARYMRGLAYADSNQLTNAINDYNVAIANCSLDCEKYFTDRGIAFSQTADYEKAELDFRQALALDANYATAYYGLGDMYYRRGDYENALINLGRAININPNDADSYAIRALIYIAQGDLTTAIGDINQGLLLTATDVDTLEVTDLTQPIEGDLELPISQDQFTFVGEQGNSISFTTLIPSGSNLAAIMVLRASDGTPLAFTDVSATGTFTSALTNFVLPQDDTYTLVVASYGAINSGAFTLTAESVASTANIDTLSLDQINERLATEPNNLELLRALGNAQFAANDTAAVLATADRLLELDPDNADAQIFLGRVALDNSDYETAIEAFSLALESAPTADNYAWRALVYRLDGQYEEAQTDLDAGWALETDNSDITYQQGLLDYYTKEYASAIENLTDYINLVGVADLAYYWRGLSYYASNDYLNAIADLTVSFENCSEQCEYELAYRGLANFYSGDLDAAEADYKQALELNDLYAFPHYGLADIAFQRGDQERVLLSYNRALELSVGQVDNEDLFGNREEYEGFIEDFTSQDEYTFDARRGDIVNLSLSPAEDLSLVMVIRGPEGRPLAMNEFDENGLLLTTVSNFIVPAPGKFTIVVAAYNANSTGGYTLTIQRR